MTILHITGSCSPLGGGPPRSIQGIVGGLDSIGQDAWLLSYAPGDKPFFSSVKKFLCAERRGLSGNREAIRRAIAQIQPDIIHCNGIWDPYAHATITEAYRAKTPCVVAPHGCFVAWAMRHKWLKKKIAWWFYMHRDLCKAAAFHATSPEEAADIRRLGFKQPIFLVPNAVEMPNPETLESLDTERQELLDNTNRTRRVLYLGRIHWQKGLPELITAWAAIQKSGHGHGWTLELVGTDGDKQQADFIALAKKLDLTVKETADSQFNTETRRHRDSQPRQPFQTGLRDFTAESRDAHEGTKHTKDSRSIEPATQVEQEKNVAAESLLSGEQSFLPATATSGNATAVNPANLVNPVKRAVGSPHALHVPPVNTAVNLRAFVPSDRGSGGRILVPAAVGCEISPPSHFALPHLEGCAIPNSASPSSPLPQVLFPGPVEDSDKWAVYNRADIFVLPSYSENFGISVAEALYARLPCIASTNTPWQELKTHNCGTWCARDAATLEKELLALMRLSDSQRTDMGIRGRQLIENKYTWPAAATLLAEHYASL